MLQGISDATHGTESGRARSIAMSQNRRLSHPIDLEDGEACSPEELEDLKRDRRSARNKLTDAATKGRPHLTEHQSIGDVVANP